MHYTDEVIDRKTGEIISVSSGDWMTLNELADVFRCGRRRLTAILREINFLQIEYDGHYNRHRIADWVINKGWGKRHYCKGSRFPFDVISPDAILWLIDRWEQAVSDYEAKANDHVIQAKQALQGFQEGRSNPMTVQMQVCWLADIFPEFTQKDMAEVLEVSQQIVSKYLEKRSKQLSKLYELKAFSFS